ncbi:MAG: imidazolonepropionase [Muribaculaceae bacterium]|nr:imidazolonepropionase [Muribaculaceae bacterium]
MNILIKNIGRLYGTEPLTAPLRGAAMKTCPSIQDAFVAVEGELVASIGAMSTCPAETDFDEVIDACGAVVTPAFCDSHTHIVWAGDRSGEFVDKINGLSYEDIARRGGGILNSADLLARTSVDDLYEQAAGRLRSMMANGTGTVEIKTGYGLTTETEMKMIDVIDRLKRDFPEVIIRATFLGAHAVGREFTGRQAEYVNYVIRDMLPKVAGRVEFIDVFCDRGFFTPEETDRILTAGAEYGLRPKIHANELDNSGGLEVGVDHHALSVDHLEQIGDREMEILSGSDTVATMLPGASFFSSLPYAPARAAVEKGCAVALASDYNPGSSPSGSMLMVWSLGCIKMRLTPEAALNAITANGAAAMGVAEIAGAVAPGYRASMIIYRPEVTALEMIPYAYTAPRISRVILSGKTITDQPS